MSSTGRLTAYLALLALVLGGLASIDALTALPSAQAHANARPSEAGAQPGRVFVLLLDSLRYQSATSPALMPYLSGMRARSAFARVTPTRDAVTVPCLRAAFTGRERNRVFGFIENFLKGNAGLESLFTQLADAGRSAAVYSDGAFDQFGDRGVMRASNGDPAPESDENDDQRDHVDEQNATAPIAIAQYRAGLQDLVVLHLTYTDHVAHEVGIDAPLYAQRYRTADALVERLDRELPPQDTLVIMGDHGHDAQGRHAVGLDVPTFALYRGPRFVAGTDLGTMSIRDHRYLLGYALGLSLASDYGGQRHPNALQARQAELGTYASVSAARTAVSAGVPRERQNTYAVVGLLLACSFGLWLQLTAARASGARPRNRALFVGSAAVCALALCALGGVFPQLRPFVHEPMFLSMSLLWLGLWSLAAWRTWRTRRLEVGAALLVLPLFVAAPTVYRYGAAVALGPVWLGWLLCLVVALVALKLPRPRPLAAIGLLALLVPFTFTESSNFRFDEWVLWPPAVLPSGFLLLSLCAKWVYLVPPQAAMRERALGALAAALLTAVQLGAMPDKLQLVAALVLGAAFGLRRREEGTLSHVALVSALLLLHHYAVRLPANAYYWQDCLLAALILSARHVRVLPAAARAYAHALLLFLAFFISGWVSFAWTLHRLEWRFLYDFWSAAFVENHVAAFTPLLVGRFALPLIAARVLLARELPQEQATRALGLAWLLAGSKVASLMFWCYGIAFVSVDSDVYLEAVQETSLACVLLLGLL